MGEKRWCHIFHFDEHWINGSKSMEMGVKQILMNPQYTCTFFIVLMYLRFLYICLAFSPKSMKKEKIIKFWLCFGLKPCLIQFYASKSLCLSTAWVVEEFCVTEEISAMELNLSDLKITLDINCLTSPSEMDFENTRRPSYFRASSYNSVSSEQSPRVSECENTEVESSYDPG